MLQGYAPPNSPMPHHDQASSPTRQKHTLKLRYFRKMVRASGTAHDVRRIQTALYRRINNDQAQREVLTLSMIQGLDYATVASKLGRGEGATRMLYSRARAALAVHVDRILNDL